MKSIAARRSRRRGLLAAAALATVLCPPPAAGADPAPPRIVAVGDIHGSYEGITQILRTTGVIDDANQWIGGDTIFVQTGDFMDRGGGVRQVLDLLMDLERQAAAQGGRALILLGNHEVMNLLGDDQDVAINPDIYAAFVDGDSEKRQKAAFREWRRWLSRQATSRNLESPRITSEVEERWMAAHPPGLVEYYESLGPDGTYGRWLRGLPVAAKLGSTLFLHAGISPEYKDRSMEELNRLHADEIRALDECRERLVRAGVILPSFTWGEIRQAVQYEITNPSSRGTRRVAEEVWERLQEFVARVGSENSPLWYRGYSEPPKGLTDQELGALLDEIRHLHGVEHIVAAHSPIGGGDIRTRLGGRVFLIDTGMLASVYNGRASALEIRGGRFEAVYENQRMVLFDEGKTTERASSTGRGAQVSRRPGPVLASWSPTAGPASAPAAASRWLDPDGQPLPFRSDAEILDFLRTAEVVSRKPTDEGKTGAEKLLLARGAVRAHAVYHAIDDRRGGPTQMVRLQDGTRVMYFRDSYKSQIAAYELGRLVGMSNIPPAVERELDGVPGSVALWIEGGINLRRWWQDHTGEPEHEGFRRQLHDMRIFDNLINNTDRTQENIFWTEADWYLWLIDHTRSFAQDPKLFKPDLIKRCSRRLYRGMKGLEERAVKNRLGDYLTFHEIKALFKRRDLLIKEIDRRIRENGEEGVLIEPEPAGTEAASVSQI